MGAGRKAEGIAGLSWHAGYVISGRVFVAHGAVVPMLVQGKLGAADGTCSRVLRMWGDRSQGKKSRRLEMPSADLLGRMGDWMRV